jgi:hypothetical protein
MALAAYSNNPASKCSLRVLLLEDSPDDAALCQRLLKKTYSEMRCEVVQTAEEFSRRIRSTYYAIKCHAHGNQQNNATSRISSPRSRCVRSGARWARLAHLTILI